MENDNLLRAVQQAQIIAGERAVINHLKESGLFNLEKDNTEDWSIPKDGGINVPDELMPLFNSVGNQFQFVEFSGKNKIIATAHIVQKAQEFFSNNPHLLNKEKEVHGRDSD